MRALYKLFKRAGAALLRRPLPGYSRPMLRLGAYPITRQAPVPRRRSGPL